jgi:hypothetical protein
MKNALTLAGCGALIGSAMLAAHADNNAPAQAPASTSSAPAASVSTTVLEAPSVPIPLFNQPSDAAPVDDANYSIVSDPEQIAAQTYAMDQARNQQDNAAALEQRAQRQAYDNDWMLRDYNEQLKKRGLMKANEVNPYLAPAPAGTTASTDTITGDDDSTTSDNSTDRTTTSQTINEDPLLAPPAKKPSAHPASSSIDDTDSLVPKKSLAGGAFAPLLPPLIPPAMATYHDPWGQAAALDDDIDPTNTSATLLPVPNAPPLGGPIAPNNDDTGSTLDVPGLTAASQGGIAPNNALDFADPASDTDNRPNGRSSANNFLAPTAPASDITEFFRKQASLLQPPNAPTTAPPLVPDSQRLPEAPPGLSHPVPSGLRSHVEDPFDILQR